MAKGEKILKFLNRPLVKAVFKSVPFVGDIVDNIENDAPAGQLDIKQAWFSAVRLAIIGVLLYLALSGKISWEEAEQGKEFLTQ